MAVLNVYFGGQFNFDDLFQDVSLNTLTTTATSFAYSGSTTTSGTGGSLTSSGNKLTGGTINTMGRTGTEGSQLYSITGLSWSASVFQSAVDAAYVGNFTSFNSLWFSVAWDMTGNHRDDRFFGGNSADVFRGGWGDDTFVGHAGADLFDGGPLNGSVVPATDAGSDTDTVNYYVEEGLPGIVADMRLATGQVKDTSGFYDTLVNVEHIRGTFRSDTYRGSDLAIYEAFSGGGGVDNADGGGGMTDEIRFDSDGGTVGVSINLATGATTDAFGNAETLLNFEWVRGTARNDVINGSSAGNRLRGYAGNDFINGSSGYDTVDYLFDRNNKNLSGVYGTENIRVDLQSGIALDGWHNQDTLQLIENVRASYYDDRILGNASNNNLELFDGDDYADGRAGNDRLYGGSGQDVLVGGDGADYLDGGDHADALYGKAGNDMLIGGRGYDTFVFDTAIGVDIDTISGYVAADDAIYLENAIFLAIGAPGALAASAFVTGAAATTAAQRIVYNQATGALFYDADGSGSGAQVQFGLIQNKVALTAAEFTVI